MVTDGDLVTAFELGELEVLVHQVGVLEAEQPTVRQDQDGPSPSDEESWIHDEGDELAFLSFTVTNSGEPLQMASDVLHLEMRYAEIPENPIPGDRPTVVGDGHQYEEFGLYHVALAEDLRQQENQQDPRAVYELATGESVNFGRAVPYEPGNTLIVDAVFFEYPESVPNDEIEDYQPETCWENVAAGPVQ